MTATCRGSYALGTACGHCTRCTDDFLDLSQKGWVQDGSGKMVPAGAVTPVPPPAPAEFKRFERYSTRCGGMAMILDAKPGHIVAAQYTPAGRYIDVTVTPDGRFGHHLNDHGYDLVGKIVGTPAAPPAPTAARICRDCRNCEPASRRDEWKCVRPSGVTDIVTGESVVIVSACVDERRMRDGDICGPAGKFWEAKP